tara:strand:- start:105 stop:305 length:201 start_codon:yes stop_codon:yes gene_type:complete
MTLKKRVDDMITMLVPMGTDSQVPGLARYGLHEPAKHTVFVDLVRDLMYDVRDHLEEENVDGSDDS